MYRSTLLALLAAVFAPVAVLSYPGPHWHPHGPPGGPPGGEHHPPSSALSETGAPTETGGFPSLTSALGSAAASETGFASVTAAASGSGAVSTGAAASATASASASATS